MATSCNLLRSTEWPTWFAAAHRVTYTECIKGHLARVGSYMFTEYYDKMMWWCSDDRATSDSESEPGFPSSPQPSTFSEAAEASPETRVVPALHNFSQLMGITSFSHKLDSLHQAFTIILSNTENCNHLSTRIEVMVLGVLGEARPQICPVAGGFLDHLMVMISSFSASSEQRTPWAAENLHILKDIFSMEESVYAVVPGSLATAVWNFVLYHIEQLIDGLEAI
ncbi:hypothetical protein AOLI_G00311090 [Acnodon oligacanthus]